MKKIIVLITVLTIGITLSGCKKEKEVDVCDGYKDFTGCVVPNFEVCDDDCNTSVNDVKYFSFQKSSAYTGFVGTYFEGLKAQNTVPDNFRVVLNKDDILNHKYADNMEFYYQFLGELRDDYFGMSTNAELCSENTITNNCILSQSADQMISASYKNNDNVFETSWENDVSSTEFTGNTKVLIRGNKALNDNSFEFFRVESGDIDNVQKNTYAFNVDGVMKVYSHSKAESSQEGFIYYMYDTNTGNYTKYTYDGLKYQLDYYIANHNKLYTIEKVKNANIEVYSVTYFDETQDYLSVRLIKQSGTFTAVNISFNLRYVDGWDVAKISNDEIFLGGTLLETNGYSLQSVVESVEGTSPFRISRDFLIDELDSVELVISDDLSFDSVTYSTVQSDINNITLNSTSYQTAFGVEFGNDINDQIVDFITSMHQTLEN
jgi:hypothetical protein